MLKILEELCGINGASGMEDAVRSYIIGKIEGKCEYHVDNLGNIIAHKKGKKASDRKLMLAAHMDEVALIVTAVNSDGTLKISPVGGIDAGVIIGRQIKMGKDGINGIIGAKAIHNLSAEERKKPPVADKLYADIGALSREDALKYVSLGDLAYFNEEFVRFGDGKILSKALDDRIGCAIMLKLMDEDAEYDIWYAFTVQEEIGLRGARTAAYTINPDFSIVLEATTASDIPDAAPDKQVCRLGGGAVVSFMDRSTMYDRELYNMAFKLAEENGIKCQTKTAVAGGNDSGAIHLSRGGVRTIAISAPCRYIHSPSSIADCGDIEACQKLASAMIRGIYNV